MQSTRVLYLDLLMRCLMDAIYEPNVADRSVRPETWWGYPKRAHSMLSVERLENVRTCIESVLQDQVPGDLIETGVWRGGTTILMRAVLKAHDISDRTVWVADSFAGLPPPQLEYPADAGSELHQLTELAVPLDEVMENFRKYDLLDEQVRFLKGWFSETLSSAPIDRLAVLRLDGDMYESTMTALGSLYSKVSAGGFVIVDDYGCVPACQAAVHDFRNARGITEPIHTIDWTGVYWRKVSGGPAT